MRRRNQNVDGYYEALTQIYIFTDRAVNWIVHFSFE